MYKVEYEKNHIQLLTIVVNVYYFQKYTVKHIKKVSLLKKKECLQFYFSLVLNMVFRLPKYYHFFITHTINFY